jgi:carboxypeptidase family protein/TonB-dependent receptor-like protein
VLRGGDHTRAAIIVLIFSGFVSLGSATTDTASVVGTVRDSSGAVVENASVTLTETQRSTTRSVLSDSRGNYSFKLLPPGNYEIHVKARGLVGTVPHSLGLDVDQTIRVDITLAVEPLKQTITVTTDPALVQTDSSALNTVIDSRKATQLPLNERNFMNFALLIPGAQTPPDGSQNASQGMAASFNGAREQSNTFYLDGMPNTDITINQYYVLPSVEAIEEFKIESSTYSAEFGHTGGSQINVVLKSGTNRFHGSAFEFLRNRLLDAKNYFDVPDCHPNALPGRCGPIPRLDRSQVGATFGGPLYRDKTFFFLSYERLHLREAETRYATVPSRLERETALDAVPPDQRNPTGAAVLNLYPAANVGAQLSTSNTFLSQPILRDDVNSAIAKLDHHWGSRDNISGHYAVTDSLVFAPVDLLYPFTDLPGYGSATSNRGQNLGLTWIHASNLSNEFQAGYNRLTSLYKQQNSGINQNAALGFPTVFASPIDLGFPEVVVAGFDAIGEPFNLPQSRANNTIQIADNVAFDPTGFRWRHHFKAGVDIERVDLSGYLDLLARGRWLFLGGASGNSLVQLLRGTPDLALAPSGNTFLDFRTSLINLYAQDDFQLNRRLSVNIGVRWEYISPPIDRKNRLSIPDLSVRSTTCSPKPDCQFILAGTSNVPRATFSPDYHNFSPRLGMAWRPFGGDRTVIRSGYGLFYDLMPLNVMYFPRLNPPFFDLQVFANMGNSTIQTILETPLPAPPVVRMLDRGFRTPYVQQWSFGVQQELPHRTLLELNYVGSKGTKLSSQRDLNQAENGIVPFPQFGPIDTFVSAASSGYHSLQLRGDKRFGQVLVFSNSYTWSKAIDDGSSLFGTATEPGLPQNSFQQSRERSLADFDTRNRFVSSLVSAMPFASLLPLDNDRLASALTSGWQVAATVTIQSGHPFTINRGIDQSQSGTAGLGIFADRPNQVSDPFKAGPVLTNPDTGCQLTISHGGRAADAVHTVQSWFNPCAFADPGLGHFGNTGRNSVVGPGSEQIDLSLSKEVRLKKEGLAIQARADFFNALNHPNFDVPDRSFDSVSFGVLRSANGYGSRPPRQIQVSLRCSF